MAKSKSKSSIPVEMLSVCRGVDIGTANIAEAHMAVTQGGVKRVDVEVIRDCFIAFPSSEANTLLMSGVEFHDAGGDQIVVVGNDALRVGAAMGVEVRRPLSSGFISEKEELSKEVVRILLEKALGTPKMKDEPVAFSIPGVPLGGDASKATFHTRFFSDRIRELGFRPIPVNEAMAIGFGALGDRPAVNGDVNRNYTGLCFSFGAGLTNVALIYQGLCSRAFSIPFGGDWIDKVAAETTNTPVSSVTLLKEEGIDLMAGRRAGLGVEPSYLVDEKTYHDATSFRQAEAIAMVYLDLLEKLRDGLETFFNDPKNRIDVREVLPVVVAGGTAQAVGFLELFNEVVLQGLKVRLALSPVGAILSPAPLEAVAVGSLKYSRVNFARTEGVDLDAPDATDPGDDE